MSKVSKQTEIQEEVIVKTVDFYKSKRLGYLNLAMRFGKCRTTIESWKRLWKEYEHQTILIAYKDNKLEETWKNELLLWNYDNPNITFVNFSSLKHYVDKIFDFIVIDEFHSASDNQRELAKSIINNDKNTKSLLLSGTVTSETKQKWSEFKEIANYSTLDGIEDGILADYEITVHVVELDTKVKTLNKKGKLLSEKQKYDNYTYVIEQMKRQGNLFMHLALARNRLSLSSLGKVNHVKSMLKRMLDKRVLIFTGLAQVADDVCDSYHSKSEDITNFVKFQAGLINHLALAAMGKVGVTYPNLDSVILLNFTYNAAETAQILNRAIKLDYKSKIADLHIIVLNEPAELKKVKESLSMLDTTKIKYL